MKNKKYVFNLETVEKMDVPELGGKAQSLYELSTLNVSIPSWFVVSDNAFYDSLTQEQKDAVSKGDYSFINDFRLLPVIQMQINRALESLSGKFFAIRSSAKSEDSETHSFAGQYETYLWIKKEDVEKNVIKVWKSGFSERVKTYQTNSGLGRTVEIPAVIIQQMVRSEKAGVAFAVDPVKGNEDTCVISAVLGLGNALVDGSTNADEYHLNRRTGEINARIAEKNLEYIIQNDQIVSKAYDERLKRAPVLRKDEIILVADLSQKVSHFFGCYQDIEWAFEKGRLYLLQSRPITTLGKTVELGTQIMIFDNSNIAESYGNVTMPLTASFIKFVYQEVYKQFCRLFGISESVIKENEEMFSRMLAFRDGRVYYNLLSWYQMLALMPFYEQMSVLMEQMMGVTEELPKEFREAVIPPHEFWGKRFRKDFRMVRHFVHELLHLDHNVKLFNKKISKALAPADLSVLSLDELASYYQDLKRDLIVEWGIPIANDFFTMVFHGTLKQLCRKWCKNPDIHNELLSGQGGIISAEPVKLTKQMAGLIKNDKQLARLLITGTRKEIEIAIHSNPQFENLLKVYMQKFSDRCMDELKLESDTLSDNPLLLYRSIGALALKNNTDWNDTSAIVSNAESEVKMDMRYYPFRFLVFRFVELQAKKMVRNRENLRFERTRVFGKVRRIFLEIGMRFSSRGALECQKDIFYLSVDEIFGYLDGTAVSYDLNGIIKARKNEYRENQKKSDPPRRFATHATFGSAPLEPFLFKRASFNNSGDDTLKGLACCPGVVRGKARVVHDPTNTAMKDGEILVAEHTDPGWITLFSMASALVIERGSLLSHAAIVSREMGIPTVVSVNDATKLISDGDIILVDGEKGIVNIIEKR